MFKRTTVWPSWFMNELGHYGVFSGECSDLVSVLRPEHEHQMARDPPINVARQGLCLVDGFEHGLIPSLDATGLEQLATQDGAVGRAAHFNFGSGIPGDRCYIDSEGDVGANTCHESATVAGRRAGGLRRGACSSCSAGGARNDRGDRRGRVWLGGRHRRNS